MVIPMPNYKSVPFIISGFEKRRCETNGEWKPEVAACTETLCKPLGDISDGSMRLTTLRIGGTATYSCNHGFGLKESDKVRGRCRLPKLVALKAQLWLK
jgi:hypothetical protein